MTDIDLRLSVEKYYKAPTLAGKGGFFVKGHGFISTAKARKLTGIKGKTRNPPKTLSAWGDYATIAMLNQSRKRSK
jgi:hypothetical protein